MTKLNQGELLEELRQIKICVQAWEILNPKKVSWTGKREQAYQQIKEMIQKPEITEEWIEEKAMGLITMVANLYPHEGSPCVIPKNKAKDFIRSLIEEVKK